MKNSVTEWFVYLVRCKDRSLYCGIARDVDKRISQHNSGKGAKYIVPGRRPVKCVWKQAASDKSAALKLEHRIKRYSATEKKALARGKGRLK